MKIEISALSAEQNHARTHTTMVPVVAARRGNMSIHTTHSPGKFQLAHIKPIFSEIGNPPNILSTQPRSLL